MPFIRSAVLSVFVFSISQSTKIQASVPIFGKDVAPIIYDNCATCHRPEGVGPFSLMEYEDVAKRADQIAEVVTSRFMPPWKPASGYGSKFIGDRSLSQEEIDLLNEWADAGAPAGDLERAPKPPAFTSDWQLGEPDLVLELPEPYLLPAEGVDIYRNFVIPASVSEKRYVKAMEFLPRSNLAIHHAVLQVDPTPTSRYKDAAEPGPGYDGMGIGASAPPEGQFVGWTPGQRPYESVEGTAWSLAPGDDIVIQLHMLPSGKVETVSPRIGLYFTEEQPSRSSLVLQMRNFEIDIPAGESDYRFEERMEIPVSIDVVGVYPHAHYIGKDLGAYAVFPDGTKEWLFRIPDWDFNWQSDYRYEAPLRIPAGSTIHMVYSYDNSADNFRNPNNPPERIRGGWRSTDEMGELSIQVLPVDEADLPALKQAQIDYEIQQAGGLSRYTYNLGSYFESQGLLQKAGAYYRESVEADPGFASGYYKLGHVLERLGDVAGAERAYRDSLKYRDELIPPRLGLARVYVRNGRKQDAMVLLEQILSWEDFNYDARVYAARIHQSNSELDKAVEAMNDGMRYHSENPYYRLELGKLLFEGGWDQEAIPHLEFAAENKVSSGEPLSQMDASVLESEALYSLGIVFRKKENASEAQERFSQAVEAMPFHKNALIASGVVAAEQGDLVLAKQRIRQLDGLPADKRPSKSVLKRYSTNSDWRSLVERFYP